MSRYIEDNCEANGSTFPLEAYKIAPNEPDFLHPQSVLVSVLVSFKDSSSYYLLG
jgi:hypothetical protein